MGKWRLNVKRHSYGSDAPSRGQRRRRSVMRKQKLVGSSATPLCGTSCGGRRWRSARLMALMFRQRGIEIILLQEGQPAPGRSPRMSWHRETRHQELFRLGLASCIESIMPLIQLRYLASCERLVRLAVSAVQIAIETRRLTE